MSNFVEMKVYLRRPRNMGNTHGIEAPWGFVQLSEKCPKS